jgi:hypothetical protein
MSVEKLSTNASLKDVMDKFEELSLQDLSLINVKVMSELPASAKEGDFVIVYGKECSRVIVSSKEPNLTDNDLMTLTIEDFKNILN